MKIVKEVKISAPINDVLAWLTRNDALSPIIVLQRAPESTKYGKNRSVAQLRAENVLSTSASERSVVSGANPKSPLVTSFDLTQKGMGTNLKVTVRGWEKIEIDKLLHAMPRVSLEWEKRLGYIKRVIESANRDFKRDPEE